MILKIVFLLIVVIGSAVMLAINIPRIFEAQEQVKIAERELAESQMEVDKALDELDASMEQLCKQSTEC